MATKDITDLQVCHAVVADKGEQQGNVEFLQAMTHEPAKVCWRALERADSRGLIEYGTSLNSAWLTERGRELLAEQA